MKHIINRYYLTLLVIIAVLYLSLCRNVSSETWLDIPYLNKIAHCVMYMGLMGTFCFDIYRQKFSSPQTVKCILSGFVFVVILGVLLEILQSYVTEYRTGDMYDVIANVIGAVLGVVVGICVSRPLARRFRRYF